MSHGACCFFSSESFKIEVESDNQLKLCCFRLDIHYILLRDTERPYAELSATTSRAVTSIKNYQNFSKDMQIGLWPKSQDKFLDVCLWEWNFWIISDVLDPPRSATFADVGYPKRGNFVLLKTHPVLCGMMIFSIKLKLHYFGLALVNAWGALPVTLHLYNACLVENLLEKPWWVLKFCHRS